MNIFVGLVGVMLKYRLKGPNGIDINSLLRGITVQQERFNYLTRPKKGTLMIGLFLGNVAHPERIRQLAPSPEDQRLDN